VLTILCFCAGLLPGVRGTSRCRSEGWPTGDSCALGSSLLQVHSKVAREMHVGFLAGACHTAKPSEKCYDAVQWAMATGIETNPEWYPGLSSSSRFEEFQAVLHKGGHGDCPEPCPVVDDCGCVPGRTGWSSRAQRCSHSSRTSPEEAAACKSDGRVDGRVDDCGCAPGRTGWSSRAQKCSSTSVTSPEAATCRSRNVSPAPVPGPPAPGTDSGKLRLMSWNVYFGNRNVEAMAQMLQRYNVDIANLQETNNRLGAIARASGLVSANTWRQVHDWCGYNFHGSDWNHSWSKEVEVPGHRGVCGALMQRGNSKLCVWGLHPIQNRNNVRFSKESIRLAADEMKRCSSQFSAPSIFMGDFNTHDWRGALRQLEQSTGWSWSLAAKDHIDFIFIQTAPLSVGRVTHARAVGSGCVVGFPGNNKRTSSCGWSDHRPVYAEIQLR